jgi:hypothetical protein
MDALDDGLEFFFEQMIAGTDVYLCSNDSCGVRVIESVPSVEVSFESNQFKSLKIFYHF